MYAKEERPDIIDKYCIENGGARSCSESRYHGGHPGRMRQRVSIARAWQSIGYYIYG